MVWVDAFLETSNKCTTSKAFHYLLIPINIPASSFSEHAFPLPQQHREASKPLRDNYQIIKNLPPSSLPRSPYTMLPYHASRQQSEEDGRIEQHSTTTTAHTQSTSCLMQASTHCVLIRLRHYSEPFCMSKWNQPYPVPSPRILRSYKPTTKLSSLSSCRVRILSYPCICYRFLQGPAVHPSIHPSILHTVSRERVDTLISTFEEKYNDSNGDFWPIWNVYLIK